MVTLDTQLGRYKGIGPGFDFLRIALAFTIVAFHAQLLTANVWVRTTPIWFLEYALVPMFFALSGFLVTASGMRLSLKNFLINRGLRIVPALAVDIFVAALVIGPLMTSVALSDYFTDIRFFKYFLNITGYIHYKLPGVFNTNHSTDVNGALWTVPYEIMCYVITSFFIVGNFLKSKIKVLLFTIAMLLGGLIFNQPVVLQHLPKIVGNFLHFALATREAQIVTAFLFGMVGYQLRTIIPYSKSIFVLALAICAITAVVSNTDLMFNILARFVLLPALAYITIYIGLTPIPIPKFFHRGDYSYGIYLYHDPLLQTIIALFPGMAMAKYSGGFFTFFAGLPLVLLLATFSWHTIERPILGLRKKFSFVAKVRGIEDVPQASIAAPDPSNHERASPATAS